MTFNLLKCDFCGDCLDRCHYMEFSKEEAGEEIGKLIEGEDTSVTEDCITCGACNWYCEKGANPYDLILRRQEETGDFTTEAGMNFMKAGAQADSEIIEGEPDRPVMSICTVGELIPKLFEGELFDGMTILKGGDYFCHLGFVHEGKETPFREGLPKAVDNLAELGTEEIIFFHDDCYAAFTTKATEFGIDLPFEPIHLIEYLRDYVEENEERIEKLDMKVAHQQPCAWRWFPNMARPLNEKLDELYELIGVERVERRYDREGSMCCGTPVLSKSLERFEEIQDRNIEDSKEAGAEAMVFTCPVCTLSLREKASEAGLEPYILSNLVRKALGEELPMGGAASEAPNLLIKMMRPED